MYFRPEPAAPPPLGAPTQHGTGVLLVNLGTPEAPTAAAVRPYLAEFLSDPRVVELPAVLWRPILHGIILRTRPAKSAKKYAAVWTSAGSPLLAHTRRQAVLLRAALQQRGLDVPVAPAMRYGQPSVGRALDELRAQGAGRILVLPAYPQYCSATTGSAFDAVFAWARQARDVPAFRLIHDYHDDGAHLDALAASVRAHWQRQGQGELLVLSFHGMPQRSIDLGDPYQRQCLRSAALLAERLSLAESQYRVTFQSRFGKAKWLEPATLPTLQALAQQGVQRVDVICPGFAADCVETLEEIDQECRTAFLAAGGTAFGYIACLNDDAAGIGAWADLAQRHLAGWLP